ncbi:MAG: nicotinate (nicotinamide) nucleotide adenylyltransferase [Bacteroidota bacterium]
MNIGLYFGTFNPIHVGHMIIANHMVEFSDLDEVWFVVTPHNPFKKKSTLLDDYHRLDIVQRAIKNYDHLRASDIEFNLPQPNYTSRTMVALEEKFTMHKFALIMGQDNLESFHKWKNHEALIDNHKIFVYPRPNTGESVYSEHKNVIHINAPLMEIAATDIRNAIKEGKNVKPLLPEGIWEYIDHQNFYR